MNFTKKAAAISAALVLSQALAAAAPAQAQGSEGRRICRSLQTTATRMGGARICKTAAQWREIDGLRERQAESEGQVFQRERVEAQPPTVAAPQ